MSNTDLLVSMGGKVYVLSVVDKTDLFHRTPMGDIAVHKYFKHAIKNAQDFAKEALSVIDPDLRYAIWMTPQPDPGPGLWTLTSGIFGDWLVLKVEEYFVPGTDEEQEHKARVKALVKGYFVHGTDKAIKEELMAYFRAGVVGRGVGELFTSSV